MENEIVFFIRFLKEHKIYYQFISYYNSNSFGGKSILEYLHEPMKGNKKRLWIIENYIIDSFDWLAYNIAHDDHIDWNQIHRDWKYFHDEYYFSKHKN